MPYKNLMARTRAWAFRIGVVASTPNCGNRKRLELELSQDPFSRETLSGFGVLRCERLAVIWLAHVQANRYRGMEKNAIFAVTIIEIRPFRNGWQVYECVGVQPVFLNREQAI